MGKINYGRVLIGGVVAGVVFIITDFLGMRLLGFDWEAWMAQYGLQDPGIATWIVLDIVFGILVVWLYAAIRPRFGVGARTAVVAAVFVWLLFGVMYWGWTAMGMFAMGDYLRFAGWGLVQTLAATLAGAWLYREESGMAAAA